MEEKFSHLTRIPIFIIDSKPKKGLLQDRFTKMNEKFKEIDLIPFLRDPNDLEKKIISHDLFNDTPVDFYMLQLVPIRKKQVKERREETAKYVAHIHKILQEKN